MKDPDDADEPFRTTPTAHAAIIGLDEVGAGLAVAAKTAWPSVRLTGIAPAPRFAPLVASGALDAGATPTDAAALLSDCGLVILALPTREAIAALAELRDVVNPAAVITDIGVMKAEIAAAAAALGLARFVGGHPVIGRRARPIKGRTADLFAGARWFLCPPPDGDPAALRLVRQWVRGLGVMPIEIDAAEHDRAFALTTHVPHLLANALAESVLEAGPFDAAGPSLREIVAVAGAPYTAWVDALATSIGPTTAALDELLERLGAIRAAVVDGDEERLRELFARGRACRETLDHLARRGR